MAVESDCPQRHESLAAIYNWLSEGFETRDVREAKTLLEALSSKTNCIPVT